MLLCAKTIKKKKKKKYAQAAPFALFLPLLKQKN